MNWPEHHQSADAHLPHWQGYIQYEGHMSLNNYNYKKKNYQKEKTNNDCNNTVRDSVMFHKFKINYDDENFK